MADHDQKTEHPLYKADKPTEVHELIERSDVDPHEPFNPEKLGLEDWGGGVFVNPEPVLIERGPDGRIVRTTPLSEVPPDRMPKPLRQDEIVQADPVPRPAPRRPQEKVVEMLAGLLMRYYSEAAPGQLPYNPLYDGIPLEAALHDDLVFQPELPGHELVHVPAHEVHQWLKQVIGKRAEIRNAKTGKLGWKGDLDDLVIRLKR